MLTEQDLKRATKGVLNFGDIFTDVRYTGVLYSSRERGTKYKMRESELFLGTPHGTAPAAVLFNPQQILVCSPSAEFMRPRFAPYFRQHSRRPPGAVRIIHRPDLGMWTVYATDPNFIHDELWAYVPIDQPIPGAAHAQA